MNMAVSTGKPGRIVWTFDGVRIRLRRIGRRIALRAIHLGIVGTIAGGFAALDRRRALHFKGWLSHMRRRNDDHTDFWKDAASAFPSDPEFVRKSVHAALQSGRLADAESGFERLMAARSTTAADCRFVVGFANVHQRAGDARGLRRRVRRFLASLQGGPDYRVAAVRLSRLIFAHFPTRGVCAKAPSRYRTRFLAMLGRSQVRAEPRHLLLRVAACEAQLQSRLPLCLLDTDVSTAERRAFVSLVRARLAEQRPFSFVRIGDGEAACLPYEPRLAALAMADARDRERIWWGEPLAPSVRARLAPRIARAMWDADCIGIPTISRYLRELRLMQSDALDAGLTGRGLRSILHCVERFDEMRSEGLPPPIFTSCHLHQELALWNCYRELFDGVKEVVLVSCHPGLAEWFGERFGAAIAGNIVLPPDRVSAPMLRQRIADDRRLPELVDEVAGELGALSRHRLVLIGAGYPGKWLVQVAKEHGGVALDLGSAFDYWLGLRTRAYLDL